jgi:hypothetical protein
MNRLPNRITFVLGGEREVNGLKMRAHAQTRVTFLGRIIVLVLVLTVSVVPMVSAFWVVNLGPAQTVEQDHFAIVAGIGGQYVSVGDPSTDNMFFFIPHAGFRYGVTEQMDVGFRLAPVPVPFTTQAPSIGGNLDAKFLFNDRRSVWKVAGLIGGGLAHVQVLNEHRFAYSPNAALLLTRSFTNGVDFTTMLRYSWMGIPTGPGGTAGNQLGIAGMSWGLKVPLLARTAFIPEFGAYRYDGRLVGNHASGFGVQYALAIGVTF